MGLRCQGEAGDGNDLEAVGLAKQVGDPSGAEGQPPDLNERLDTLPGTMNANHLQSPGEVTRSMTPGITGEKALDVYISLNVVSLFSVNTIDETFTVRLNVTLLWAATGEGNIWGINDEEEIKHLISGLDDKDIDWIPNWFPQFGLRNKIESQESADRFVTILTDGKYCLTEEEWDKQIKEKNISKDNFWVMRETTMNAVINKSQHLRLFPFDIQELMIAVRMEHSASQVHLSPINDLPDQIRKRVPKHLHIPCKKVAINFDNLDTAEFHVWRQFPCVMNLGNDFRNRSRRCHCGAVQVGIFVERHMAHYIYNVFAMVLAITSLTASSWSIPATEISNRLAFDVALLLTGQAFKLVIADKLPKVNYLTIVDTYILFCFAFIIAGMIMHSRAGWRGNANEKLDDMLMEVWLQAWGVFNVLFFIVTFILRCRNTRRLKQWVAKSTFELLDAQEVGVEKEIQEDESRRLTLGLQLFDQSILGKAHRE